MPRFSMKSAMSGIINLGIVSVNKIDHFLLAAIKLFVTSSQSDHVYLLQRSCIFYGFQSNCRCSLSVYSSVCQIRSKVRWKKDSYRTSACSALCMTFPTLTHSRGLRADVQWTRTKKDVTSVSRFSFDCVLSMALGDGLLWCVSMFWLQDKAKLRLFRR